MFRKEKILLIGATARQSGKTELASYIINRFSGEIKITGIKITTVQKGDASLHGSIALPAERNFTIEESSHLEKGKSTDRMLVAGAGETFWVHTRVEYLEEAWKKLSSRLDSNAFIVCESNSLRRIVKPDLFIMIRNLKREIKESVIDLMGNADLIIDFDGNKFLSFDIGRLGIKNNKWIINKF